MTGSELKPVDEPPSEPQLTLTDIREEVSTLLERPHPNSLYFRAGVILLSLVKVGDSPERVCEFTGYSLNSTVKNILRRINTSGIYKDGILYCNWMDEETGTLSFMLDILVACGEVKRVA